MNARNHAIAAAPVAIALPDSGNVKICGKRKDAEGKIIVKRRVAKDGKTVTSYLPDARVATTYTTIEGSCDPGCASYVDGSCYAKHGMVAMTTRRLDAAQALTQLGPIDIARQEAAAIDALYPRSVPDAMPMRLHTAGDCRTDGAASTVAAAALRWRQRGGGKVWSYTHAWRRVKRASWGGVSVLASIDTPEQAAEARARGYAPARVVASFPNGARTWTDAHGTWIPCPAQTQDERGIGCAQCRLCWDADKLHVRGAGIAFEAHGAGAGKLKRRLAVL